MRVTKIVPRFLEDLRQVSPGDRARAVRELSRLAGADPLPLAGDYEMGIPPTGRAWVRRIPQTNLWVLYLWTAEALIAKRLLRSPPVPLDP